MKNSRCWAAALCLGLMTLLGGRRVSAEDPERQKVDEAKARMKAEGWKEISPNVFERQLGPTKVEHLGFGREGLSWTIGDLNQRIARLQREYKSYPSKDLANIIADLTIKSAKARRELPSTSYKDRKGRRKLVRYWLMKPLEGGFEPHDEVDEIRWLRPEKAVKKLTYGHDKELIRDALRRRRLQLHPGRRRDRVKRRISRPTSLGRVREVGAPLRDHRVQRAIEVEPDVALIDVSLPDGSGIDLVKQIKASNETTLADPFGDGRHDGGKGLGARHLPRAERELRSQFDLVRFDIDDRGVATITLAAMTLIVVPESARPARAPS